MTDAGTTPHQRLAELVRGIRVAMMTTIGAGGDGHAPGQLHARPMYTQAEPTGEDLWFLADRRSSKVGELVVNSAVLLTYADPHANRFVAVTGAATVHEDHDKARELWSPGAQGWFPQGPTDPNLVLIRVHPEHAEYWDGPGMLSYSISLLKALVTGTRVEPKGDHGEVALT
jgi:general stress protein 26